MIITNKEYHNILGIHTGRIEDKNENRDYFNSTTSHDKITEGCKVYIVKNELVSKLRVRRWLKSRKAIQVFEMKDADCIITSQNYTNTVRAHYIRYLEEEYVNQLKSKLDWFNKSLGSIDNNYYDYYVSYSNNISNKYYKEMKELLPILKDNLISGYKVIYNKSNKYCIDKLLDKSLIIVNEIDLNEELYDYEIRSGQREDLSDLLQDWDKIEELLFSDNIDIAIEMLKVGDLRTIMTDLIITCLKLDDLGDLKLQNSYMMYSSIFRNFYELGNFISDLRYSKYHDYNADYTIKKIRENELFNFIDADRIIKESRLRISS